MGRNYITSLLPSYHTYESREGRSCGAGQVEGNKSYSLYLNAYSKTIDIVFLAPIDKLHPHFLSILEVKFAGSKEPEQVLIVPLRICGAIIESFDCLPKLLQCLELFFGTVPQKSM